MISNCLTHTHSFAFVSLSNVLQVSAVSMRLELLTFNGCNSNVLEHITYNTLNFVT